MRDTTTIDNERTAKQNELIVEEKNCFKVSQEILLLQREIVNLQAKKKDLEISASKSSHNIRILKIQLKQLENEYWNTKHI